MPVSVTGHDSLKARRTLDVDGKRYDYFSLNAAAKAAGLGDISRLPVSLKILLENLVRLENGRTVTVDDIKAVGAWLQNKSSDREIAFRPARVLMQDLTGVPAVVDLAAMRQAMLDLGGDPNKINPLSPVDLVIDHSVQIDSFASKEAFARNVKIEFERNGERYRFLRWGGQAFENFRLVPPGTGICHQVNLEYLSQVVWTTDEDGKTIAYPDTLVGTDSHTTMVNGLSVLGWGVGGIEAEAAMLGQPISMLIPEVVGVRLTGRMAEGATATDLVLTITQMLRRRGVVGRFVEYFGPGVAELALADRATIGNMSPEYGATCGFFPIDAETIRYLTITARDPARAKLVEACPQEHGLKVKPWVKTSLAPGSQVVSDYYAASGLQDELDKLGFNLVGYGCTTCIGNSGPLPEPISEAIDEGDLAVAAVLSGNRNFEGRIHAQVRANYLASPPLVVAYALAGTIRTDLTKDPLGEGGDGKPVYLRDIWPSNREVADTVAHSVSRDSFKRRYGNVFEGPPEWREIRGAGGLTYNFDDRSTYLALAPYFENMPKEPGAVSDVIGARELAIFGDSITTDHISPAGSIKTESPAGEYLISYQVRPSEFNTYGARRGNPHVMTPGTFANIRIRNEMVPGVEGGMTKLQPDGKVMPIYDAAMEYKRRGVPLVIFGGKEYGTGSSRDWAAKGTLLLGVKAVIVESFERIHRSNLVGMGVLPLQFRDGVSRQTLKLTGAELLDITGVEAGLKPRMLLTLRIHDEGGGVREEPVICRIDTLDELEYYRHGGILQYVLRSLLKAA